VTDKSPFVSPSVGQIISLGTRREVFWDDHIVDDARTTAEKRLHHPIRKERVMECDQLWEGDACYFPRILKDGELYRMYYFAGCFGALRETPPPDSVGEPMRVCYAESRDGLHWEKPNLGLCEYNGSTDNNILLDAMTDDWHNPKSHGGSLFVMKDPNPSCPAEELYKAVYGVSLNGRNALKYVASPDGIHFRHIRTLLEIPFCFDSLNSIHFNAELGKYLCYFRGWHTSDVNDRRELRPGNKDNTRDIRRMESEDFIHWSDPVPLDYGEDAPDFQLYTNAIEPYYRAPHLLVGFPSRYYDRGIWTDSYEQLCGKELRKKRMEIQPRFGYAVTDTLFMSSRDTLHFHRPSEAFIRPEQENNWSWVYGENFVSAGLFEVPSEIPGGFPELSMLLTARRFTDDPRGVFLYRYAIRPDGFISRCAGYEPKELTTKPFRFDGNTLTLNFETSALGYVRIEILDKNGRPVEGYRCCELFGNTIDRKVSFDLPLEKIQEMPIRLKFTLCDADIYSFRFC